MAHKHDGGSVTALPDDYHAVVKAVAHQVRAELRAEIQERHVVLQDIRAEARRVNGLMGMLELRKKAALAEIQQAKDAQTAQATEAKEKLEEMINELAKQFVDLRSHVKATTKELTDKEISKVHDQIVRLMDFLEKVGAQTETIQARVMSFKTREQFMERLAYDLRTSMEDRLSDSQSEVMSMMAAALRAQVEDQEEQEAAASGVKKVRDALLIESGKDGMSLLDFQGMTSGRIGNQPPPKRHSHSSRRRRGRG